MERKLQQAQDKAKKAAPVATAKQVAAVAKVSRIKADRNKAAIVAEAKPDNSATLVQLCNLAEAVGFSRGYAVKLTGGDGCRNEPVDPVFKVTVVGNRKFVKREALTALCNRAVAAKKITKRDISPKIKEALARTTNVHSKGIREAKPVAKKAAPVAKKPAAPKAPAVAPISEEVKTALADPNARKVAEVPAKA